MKGEKEGGNERADELPPPKSKWSKQVAKRGKGGGGKRRRPD